LLEPEWPIYNDSVMTAPTPIRRRWFQFSLGWLVALVTLLTIIWWQASTWAVADEQLVLATFNGDRRPGGFMNVNLSPPPSPRSPTTTEAFRRGTEWSLVTLVVCIVGDATIRYIGRYRNPTS